DDEQVERLGDLGLAAADLDVDAAAERLPEDVGAAGGVDDGDLHLALVDEGEQLPDEPAERVVDAARVLDVKDEPRDAAGAVYFPPQPFKDFPGRSSITVQSD